MVYSYRITKYSRRSEHGFLTSDYSEWTSFFDVGVKATLEEYMVVEDAYVRTVVHLCLCCGVSTLQIGGLEIYTDDKTYTYKNGDWLTRDEIQAIVRMILREKLWCKLKSDLCEFHFGYDYYMYFVSNQDPAKCIAKIQEKLYIEEFLSPYIDIL